LSTTDDAPAPTAVSIISQSIADPAPLGLAAFALTTFLLGSTSAGWANNTSGLDWLGYALGYGGLVQLLAGMWEFRNRNVFGSTAFSTYGGFWIGLGLWVILSHASTTDKDLGWIFLAFAIFNTYMLIWSTQLNMAVFGVFLTLELTEILVFIGNFSANTTVGKAAGYVAVITALVAWYTSAAGVINGMKGRAVLPVGKPLFNL
jgi:uncharacterized protein